MDTSEDIPAYSMWKTFNDTIPVILSMDSSENNLKRFTNILRHPEFSEMFLYNPTEAAPLEHCESMNQKYKAFTVWLLGRFFYMLSLEKLSKIHDLLIDAQKRILHRIEMMQDHIYRELTLEYTAIIRQLNDYQRSKYEGVVTLKAFVPQNSESLRETLDLTPLFVQISTKTACLNLLKVTLQFIEPILIGNLEFSHANSGKILEDLIFILENNDLDFKVAVFEIYVKILMIDEDFSPEIARCLRKFFSIYELNFERLERVSCDILRCKSLEKRKREAICELILSGTRPVGDELFGICEAGVGEEFYIRTDDFRYLELTRRQIVREILRFYEANPVRGQMTANVSDTWQFIYGKFWINCKASSEECVKSCIANDTLYRFKMLIELAVGVKTGVKSNVTFFEEGILFPTIMAYLHYHFHTCKVDFGNFSSILSNLLFAVDCDNGELYFQMVGIPFLRQLNDFKQTKVYEGLNWVDTRRYMTNMYKAIYVGNPEYVRYHMGFEFEEIQNFENVLYSMNLALLNQANLPCQSWFIKICKYIFIEKKYNLQAMIPNYIATIISNSTNVNEIIDEIILPLLKSENEDVLFKISENLPDLITVLSTKHKIFIEYDRTSNISKIKLKLNSGDLEFKEYERKLEDLSTASKIVKILKGIFALLSKKEDVRRNVVLALPTLSKNILLFHQISIPKWMVLLEDSSVEVRQAFANNISEIIAFSQENPNLKQEIKEKTLEIVFTHLGKSMKASLQTRKDLQETILSTIINISSVKHEVITINVMKLLLYFIMIPTSRYSLVAINGFTELAKRNKMTVQKLYSKHRREVCRVTIELCAINQALAEYALVNSLERVSLMFGFFGTKDFIIEETRYLLPLLVALVIKMPNVKALIEEIATLNDLELSELLSRQYGYIFLHVFLNGGPDESKKTLDYVEESAGTDGLNLRKRNVMIILNELLLNFSEKRERVLLALNHLSKDDPDSAPFSIQEFLQKRFLGVLQYFDFKLIAPHSNKRKVLLSLAAIFEYMGAKHISPLRFKIIAMLRTALNLNYGLFPELNCDVWETFIHSCDIETLGPQLATIFVSILPLVKINKEKINRVFQYLVVEHQKVLKDVIPDLFFVLDFNVDERIHQVISSHLKVIQDKDFKEHLKSFMKYLSYEMIDVRIYALKYIRLLMQKNRAELDEMILGYNGIDPIIVELLDSLTQGCREQDAALRLACGECIGELGAVEPSHLPRRSNREENTFNLFVNEPTFIVSSLSELLRALQSEKNTQDMDRFALAIQETLKTYGISPEFTSQNHDLWKLFPESHQQLMLPLLSSKYTMVQCFDIISVSPIYGSNIGSNYQTWLHNWCISLVTSIKSTKQNLLQVYLVSMKQDHKTLMYFLPYILLHALIEGDPGNQDRILNEFKTVLKSKCSTPLTNSTLNVRPVRAHNFALMEQDDVKVLIQNEQYIKVIFVLLDFLDRWLREWLWEKGYSGRDNNNYKDVKNFVSNFSKLQLAKCNFECGEYPRALMYLEDYMLKNKAQTNENLSLLAEIYYRLGEPDGVAGVIAVSQSEPSIEQRILALEVSGKLSDAAACYERLSLPLSLSHIQGLMRCYLDLDNVNTALNMAQGVMERQPEYSNWMLEAQAEPLWRLGRYDDLDELLQRSELKEKKTWATQIGSSLLAFQKGDRELFKNTIADIKRSQVNTLGEASLEEGAYQHGYFYISRLHALNELEQVEKVAYELLLRPNDSNACKNIINQLKTEWDLRLKLVQQTVKFIEPILCLRRVAVEQAKNIIRERVPASVAPFDSLLGESWLKSAEIAMAAEVHQQAYTYILKAEQYAPPKLFLEKAKLHWIREEHEQAFTTLCRGLGNIIPEGVVITRNSPLNNLSLEEKKICAEAKLLIASYNDSISNVDMDMNIQHYREAMEMFKEWEKSLICLAQYYDRVFQTFSDQERDVKGADIQIYMINYFGKSLQYGTRYIYQSLPRLLSIWFDYGTRLLDETSSKIREERKDNLLKMTKLVDTFLERLPSYIFLTAFSQLVSRICHPQKEVQLELKAIIIKLILKYPQHSLWMIISVIKSSYSVRSKRCSEILSDSRLKTAPMLKLLSDFTKLAERLIELCNKDISDNVQSVSINTFLRVLPRLISKSDFSEIMIPTQSFRKLVLPNPAVISSQHNPFPNHYVHIVGIDDEMMILQSLQRPRKIVFRGSDGKGYVQMLKPKDDLRKDFRLMEFNHIVNQLLSQDPESRQRRLNIRLYSVAPLNEECGLIEWIPNLVGFRPVLMTLYKQRGLGMKGKELKEVGCKQTDSLENKRNIFLNRLLPRHPPILGDWFRKTFPDVQGWLIARTAYIRTTAVMSMVGYVLGLGDRHGENILLDSTSGDIVHVDFNCLFNKGELFEWPERVPFRLTQNMVAAMGPLGVEGVFRKSSACALRVLRNHTNTLMSIVTPFVYDPLVSWPRNAQSTTNANSERTNVSALDNIREIRCRLQGQVRTKSRTYSIPLSVEGQTNYLITEAMYVDNLCQMYIGWGPYL